MNEEVVNEITLTRGAIQDLAHMYKCCRNYINTHREDEKKSFEYWECMGKMHVLERINYYSGSNSTVLAKEIQR